MRQDFEDGVYWDELAEICGDISRAAEFRGAARFRGNTVSVLVPSYHNPQVRQTVIFIYHALFATPTEATQLCIMTGHAQALHR